MVSFQKIFVAATLVLGFSLVSFGQEERVHFGRGKSSATLTGKIAPNGEKSYVLGAKAGQCMQLSVTSTNKKVTVDVGGNDLGSGDKIPLRSTDDYIITLHNSGSSTNYSLSLIIKKVSCE